MVVLLVDDIVIDTDSCLNTVFESFLVSLRQPVINVIGKYLASRSDELIEILEILFRDSVNGINGPFNKPIASDRLRAKIYFERLAHVVNNTCEPQNALRTQGIRNAEALYCSVETIANILYAAGSDQLI